MRFRVVFAVALAAAWAAAATAGAALNPQHAGLQVALRAQGLYLGPIDAIVGPHTVAAVRRFQRAHGLHVTGLPDAATRRELGPPGKPLFGSPALTRGCLGRAVAVLPFRLKRSGIRVPGTPFMGKSSVSGLRSSRR